MTQGRFLSFEGGEGAGKTTQIALLADHLRGAGLDVIVTREPGGTDGAEAIRALLLGRIEDGWGPRAEALLFAAARADHVEKLIRPALARGAWVLSDRYVDSSRAYQGGGFNLGDEAIMALHGFGSEGLLPDMTLFLTLPQDESISRAHGRDQGQSDAIGGRDAGFHARVARQFAMIAAQEPQRFRTIDASGTREAVSARITTAIAPLLAHSAA